ncbi:MAG: universal stress protein [Noviherbaspirillum sp.]
MSRFASLLLPLDGSPEAAKGAGCALWLAQALNATLHVLHAAAQPFPAHEALARLHVAGVQQPRIVLHQVAGDAEAAVLKAIAEQRVDLVAMSARGESASGGLGLPRRMGSVAQAVIERCPVPILLFPARYREALPWTSMVVAASGEMAADRALEAGARLAAELGLKVTVVHVEDGPRREDRAPFGAYADAPHHEYRRRTEEMIERGLAGCTAEECRCIGRVLLRHGDPAMLLLEQTAREGHSVLALGWHGKLGAGRALVLKRLLEEASCALLIVRGPEKSTARLKTGDEIDG